jgi:hypothetical protein
MEFSPQDMGEKKPISYTGIPFRLISGVNVLGGSSGDCGFSEEHECMSGTSSDLDPISSRSEGPHSRQSVASITKIMEKEV